MTAEEREPWLRVMSEKCGTCIFGPESPVGPERFAELRALWEKQGAEHWQVCHHSATGWSDADLDEPEREEQQREIAEHGIVCRGWFDEFYVRRRVPVQVIQVAERLGRLGIANVEDYPI